MNLLSLLSFFCAYSLVLGGIHTLRLNRRSALNRLSALVDFCFAFWAFCCVFFYAAPTVEQAWLWHRLSALGWIPFCAFAVHFFLLLSEQDRRIAGRLPYVVLYGLPLPLLLYALFGAGTPLAAGLVPAGPGLGWRYVSNAASPWCWAYLAYLLAYFSAGLAAVYRWGRKDDRRRRREQATRLIRLDVLVLLCALYTDMAAPALGHPIPPLGNLLTVFWLVGFLRIIKKYEFLSMRDAANADLILETIMDPVLFLDLSGNILKCNHAASQLLKRAHEELVGQPLSGFLKDAAYDRGKTATLFRKKRLTQVPLDLEDSRGRVVNALASFSLAETKLDGPVGIVANLHDVTCLRETEAKLIEREEKARALAAELHRAAHYDKLTGLPNRRLFFAELGKSLTRARNEGSSFAVAFIDLDGFKAINDTRGHDVGDALLAIVAERLRSLLKEGDLAARMGGDEFVVLFRSDPPDDDRIAAVVRQPFSGPVVVGGIPCPVGLSVGVSRCPDDGMSADGLMKAADERMYRDKQRYRGLAGVQTHFHQADGAPDA